MSEGWGVKRGREGRLTATNTQSYAHVAQFADENLRLTGNARNGRELVEKVGREVLREVIAVAYNRAIALTT